MTRPSRRDLIRSAVAAAFAARGLPSSGAPTANSESASAGEESPGVDVHIELHAVEDQVAIRRGTRVPFAARVGAWALRGLVGLVLVASTAAQAASDISSPGMAPEVTVAPVTVPQVTAAPRAAGPLDSIRNWLGGSSSAPELLPPEQAFQLSVRAKDAHTLIATLTPAKDYYLYRDRITFSIQDPPRVTVDEVSIPRGEIKADATFGNTEVFHRPVDAVIRLGGAGAWSKPLQLRATYQGCNEPLGVCYPPIEKMVTVAPPGAVGVDPGSPPNGAARAPVAANDDSTEGGYFRELFAAGSSWAIVAAFFGLGLLLAFTPCMLPMIPILSGIIVGQGHHLTRRHALGLSAVYVLAMAITYALAGMAAGLAGTLLTAYLQSRWVLGAFAAIFVLLALSMFGFYELQLPTALQSRLATAGARVKGGRLIGVFLMGMLSALIVGPCVAAPLAGALLYIGQTRDVVLGGTALFAMALGMGVPLLVVGATAGTLLPKAGAWMESVKRFFGVAMLALAIYLVSPLLSVVVQMLLWSALLILSAMTLRAIDPLPPDAGPVARLSKGIGMMALVVGISLLIGALSGGRDVLQPLTGIRSATSVSSGLAFQPVKSLAELQTVVQAAQGRAVMLDFWAEWCVSCKEMERFTFSDSRVQARLNGVLLLRADVTANNRDDQALLRRFALFGPPGIVFFDKQGQERAQRVIGFQPPERFLTSLDRAIAR